MENHSAEEVFKNKLRPGIAFRAVNGGLADFGADHADTSWTVVLMDMRRPESLIDFSSSTVEQNECFCFPARQSSFQDQYLCC